jgi:hypothetical protein
MSSKAIRKRQRAGTARKSRSGEQSSTSSLQITDMCSTSSEDSPVTLASRSSNKRLKHNCSRRSQLQAKKEEKKLAKPHEQQHRDALDNLQNWTWEVATSKPPRPHTPEVGPMDEDPCYDDPISTRYQGLPKELCDHIRDMMGNIALKFEQVYREEKERELRGAGSEVSAEQMFLEKVEKYKQREHFWQAKAELKARELERIQHPGAELKAHEDPRRNFEGKGEVKSIWSRWEGNNEADDWPKWGEEQLDVVDRASAEFNYKPDSFDLVSPMSEDSGYTADLDEIEIEIDERPSIDIDLSYLTSPKSKNTINVNATKVNERPESIDITSVQREFLLSPEEDTLAIKIVDSAPISAYPYEIEYDKATAGNSPQNPIVIRG